MKRIQTNGLQVELNGLLEVATVAICVSQIVEALNLLWVDHQSLSIVDDRLLDIAQDVLSIAQVVEHVGDLVIDLDCSMIILNRLLSITHVIECISEANQRLKFVCVVIESLSEVFASRLGIFRFK